MGGSRILQFCFRLLPPTSCHFRRSCFLLLPPFFLYQDEVGGLASSCFHLLLLYVPCCLLRPPISSLCFCSHGHASSIFRLLPHASWYSDILPDGLLPLASFYFYPMLLFTPMPHAKGRNGKNTKRREAELPGAL